MADLNGKKIGGQKGSLGAELIKNNPDIMSQIHSLNDSYENIPQILGDLKTLGIDACVGDISLMAEDLGANGPQVASMQFLRAIFIVGVYPIIIKILFA